MRGRAVASLRGEGEPFRVGLREGEDWVVVVFSSPG